MPGMCDLGENTAKHVLMECPEYCGLRMKYWATKATLQHKLDGHRQLQTPKRQFHLPNKPGDIMEQG